MTFNVLDLIAGMNPVSFTLEHFYRFLDDHPGIDVNMTNDKGQTGLILAAQTNNRGVAELLLTHHANLNVHDNDGKTALMHVVIAKHTDIFLELLRQPSLLINAHDPSGQTALLWAIFLGRTYMVSQLLEHPDLDVNAGNSMGVTPLMSAVHQPIDTIKPLLARQDLRIDLADKKGDTALMVAGSHGHSAAVDLLLQHHANPNHQNHQGETVLMRACENTYADVVQVLLDHHDRGSGHDGALNFLLRDHQGRLAQDFCTFKDPSVTAEIQRRTASQEAALLASVVPALGQPPAVLPPRVRL